jgi:acid phosphatase (class B)
MNLFKRYTPLIIITFISLSACATRYVTVEDIERSLVSVPPMAVGFDVDDTVLFSSAIFNHVTVTACDGAPQGCTTPLFWEKINSYSTFALPKPVGLEIAKMHLDRGDTVYFITARTGSDNETLSDTLRDLLDAPDLNPVVFVGGDANLSKTIAMEARDIQIYYGDADSDITDARAAGATGIRIIRAKNSTVSGETHPGIYGEDVVRDSE